MIFGWPDDSYPAAFIYREANSRCIGAQFPVVERYR
jgi:hypothetical protein